MEREERHLERHPDGDEGEGGDGGAAAGDGAELLGHVDEVQGAGHHEQQPDADDVEGGADRAQHEVLIGGDERAPVAPHGDERIGGEGRDLEEDEGVEGVARDRDAEEASEGEKEDAVVPAAPLGRDFVGDRARRPGHHQRGHQRDDDEHQCIGLVDPVFDADGRRPTAEGVGDRAAFLHL